MYPSVCFSEVLELEQQNQFKKEQVGSAVLILVFQNSRPFLGIGKRQWSISFGSTDVMNNAR